MGSVDCSAWHAYPSTSENRRRLIGSYAKATKLTRKEAIIQELSEKRVSQSAISRILGVNRGTLTSFVKRHGLERQ